MDAVNKFNTQTMDQNTQTLIRPQNPLIPTVQGVQSQKTGTPTVSVHGNSERFTSSTSVPTNPSSFTSTRSTISNAASRPNVIIGWDPGASQPSMQFSSQHTHAQLIEYTQLSNRTIGTSNISLDRVHPNSSQDSHQFRQSKELSSLEKNIDASMQELLIAIGSYMKQKFESQASINTCISKICFNWDEICHNYVNNYEKLEKLLKNESLLKILNAGAQDLLIKELLINLYTFTSKWYSIYQKLKEQTQNDTHQNSELLSLTTFHYRSLHILFKLIWNTYLNTYFKLSGQTIEHFGLLPMPEGRALSEGQLMYVYDTHLQDPEFIITLLSKNDSRNIQVSEGTYYKNIWSDPVHSPQANVRGVIFKINDTQNTSNQTITVLDQPVLLMQIKNQDMCRLEIVDYNISEQNSAGNLPAFSCATKTYIFEDSTHIDSLCDKEILIPGALQTLENVIHIFLQNTYFRKEKKLLWMQDTLRNNIECNRLYYLPLPKTSKEVLDDILLLMESMTELERNGYFYRLTHKLLLTESSEDVPLKLLIEHMYDGLPLETIKESAGEHLQETYKKTLSTTAKEQAKASKAAAKAQKRADKKQEQKSRKPHKAARNMPVQTKQVVASTTDSELNSQNKRIEAEALQRIAELEADCVSIKKSRHLDSKLNELTKYLTPLGISLSRNTGTGSHETLTLARNNASLKITSARGHKGTASASDKLVFIQVVKATRKLLEDKTTR